MRQVALGEVRMRSMELAVAALRAHQCLLLTVCWRVWLLCGCAVSQVQVQCECVCWVWR